jgi:integrase
MALTHALSTDMPLGVVEELTEWLARRPAYEGSDDPLFVTEPPNGRPVSRQTRRNIAAQLKTAITRANERPDRLGIEPISERVTPHSLRRTCASLRAACGDDPVYIAEQLGHADMNLTFRIYQRAVKRRAKLSGNHLAEFDRALEWAQIGAFEDVQLAGKGRISTVPTRQVAENRLSKP